MNDKNLEIKSLENLLEKITNEKNLEIQSHKDLFKLQLDNWEADVNFLNEKYGTHKQMNEKF